MELEVIKTQQSKIKLFTYREELYLIFTVPSQIEKGITHKTYLYFPTMGSQQIRILNIPNALIYNNEICDFLEEDLKCKNQICDASIIISKNDCCNAVRNMDDYKIKRFCPTTQFQKQSTDFQNINEKYYYLSIETLDYKITCHGYTTTYSLIGPTEFSKGRCRLTLDKIFLEGVTQEIKPLWDQNRARQFVRNQNQTLPNTTRTTIEQIQASSPATEQSEIIVTPETATSTTQGTETEQQEEQNWSSFREWILVMVSVSTLGITIVCWVIISCKQCKNKAKKVTVTHRLETLPLAPRRRTVTFDEGRFEEEN